MISFDVNAFVNSRLGLLLGPVLSQDKAYRLTDWGSRQVARRSKSKAMRILRENQAVVRGLPNSAPELDGAVLAVLKNAGRGYVRTGFELWPVGLTPFFPVAPYMRA